MNEEINRINRVLPDTDPMEKADAIRQWIQPVIKRIGHYRAEHKQIIERSYYTTGTRPMEGQY